MRLARVVRFTHNILNMNGDAIVVVQGTFQNLLAGVLAALPQIVGAVVVLVIGLVIAWALCLVVEKIISAVKIDDLMDTLQVTSFFKKMGVSFKLSALIGWLVKWFVIVVFLIAAADILGWSQITLFLNDVVDYIPNAIIAIVILLVGIVLGSFVNRVVRTAVSASGLGGEDLLAGISKWAIFVFALIAALQQLGIATILLQTITTGIVAMLALAGGLAFGLGGQEDAKRFLSKLRKDISNN